ncbi:MAG: hypothetical protein HY660_18260 [Armatimonadetes bacterium]|nr:hypothetical protein [Armatimonadota bacterium]
MATVLLNPSDVHDPEVPTAQGVTPQGSPPRSALPPGPAPDSPVLDRPALDRPGVEPPPLPGLPSSPAPLPGAPWSPPTRPGDTWRGLPPPRRPEPAARTISVIGGGGTAAERLGIAGRMRARLEQAGRAAGFAVVTAERARVRLRFALRIISHDRLEVRGGVGCAVRAALRYDMRAGGGVPVRTDLLEDRIVHATCEQAAASLAVILTHRAANDIEASLRGLLARD